ncbi:MAG: hypothetical protein WKF37_05790 [Bryobacteraceae bacterium]
MNADDNCFFWQGSYTPSVFNLLPKISTTNQFRKGRPDFCWLTSIPFLCSKAPDNSQYYVTLPALLYNTPVAPADFETPAGAAKVRPSSRLLAVVFLAFLSIALAYGYNNNRTDRLECS